MKKSMLETLNIILKIIFIDFRWYGLIITTALVLTCITSEWMAISAAAASLNEWAVFFGMIMLLWILGFLLFWFSFIIGTAALLLIFSWADNMLRFEPHEHRQYWYDYEE